MYTIANSDGSYLLNCPSEFDTEEEAVNYALTSLPSDEDAYTIWDEEPTCVAIVYQRETFRPE